MSKVKSEPAKEIKEQEEIAAKKKDSGISKTLD